MSNIIEPRVLKGFKDSLPETESAKRILIKKLEAAFKSFGFLPIDTPVLEYTEVLLGKGGGETDKQVYRFQDHGKRDVSMRFDLTVPFARFMASHINELYLPFRRYHIAKVWRGENTQKGRYREFFQCDFDIVGVDSASADFEILYLMYHSLKNLGIDRFKIKINHRAVFHRFLSALGVQEQSQAILRTVDKIHKIGEEKIQTLLSPLISEDKIRAVLDFIEPGRDFETTLGKMVEAAGGESEDTKRLKELYTYMREVDIASYFELDPSITRGLDYYTALVFETFLTDLPQIGSIFSGGRYNNLASLYTKEQLPGVGSSLGLDRLLAALEELNAGKTARNPVDVIIFFLDSSLLGYYHKLAAMIRAQGNSCEVYPQDKKFKQQFSYAEKKNIPLAVICGKEERSTGTVTIKDLVSRESYNDLSPGAMVKKVAELLQRDKTESVE